MCHVIPLKTVETPLKKAARPWSFASSQSSACCSSPSSRHRSSAPRNGDGVGTKRDGEGGGTPLALREGSNMVTWLVGTPDI